MLTPLQINLRPTYEISRITKGGWQLAGDHGTVEQSRAVNDMIAFYDAGITTFDCADIYKGVEEMIGEFLRKLKNRRGAAAMRDDLRPLPSAARRGRFFAGFFLLTALGSVGIESLASAASLRAMLASRSFS